MPSSINVTPLLLSRQKLSPTETFTLRSFQPPCLYISTLLLCNLSQSFFKSLCIIVSFIYKTSILSFKLSFILFSYNCYRLLGWFYCFFSILSSLHALHTACDFIYVVLPPSWYIYAIYFINHMRIT
jgi:hypothetical protein